MDLTHICACLLLVFRCTRHAWSAFCPTVGRRRGARVSHRKFAQTVWEPQPICARRHTCRGCVRVRKLRINLSLRCTWSPRHIHANLSEPRRRDGLSPEPHHTGVTAPFCGLKSIRRAKVRSGSAERMKPRQVTGRDQPSRSEVRRGRTGGGCGKLTEEGVSCVATGRMLEEDAQLQMPSPGYRPRVHSPERRPGVPADRRACQSQPRARNSPQDQLPIKTLKGSVDLDLSSFGFDTCF